MLRWGKRIAIIFIVCLLLLTPLGVVAIISNQQANISACEEANDVRTVLTNVLTRAQVVAASNEEFTQAEKEAAQKFYRRGLNELANHHC